QFYELSTQQLTVSAQDDRFKLSAKLISQTSTSTGKALCCLVEGSRSENTNCDVVHGFRGKLLQQQYVLPMSRPFRRAYRRLRIHNSILSAECRAQPLRSNCCRRVLLPH